MNSTKANSIFEIIRQDIIDGHYSAGEMINERDLAEKYGVSKTPIREALTALVSYGFLVKYPRRGYFIKEIDMNEYMDLLQYRFLIEADIAYYIIKTCSDDQIRSLYEYTPEIAMTFEEWQEANARFHLALAELTGNKYLINALATVFNQTKRKTSITGYKSLGNDVHAQHRVIVDCLLTRNIKEVWDLLKKDLERSDEDNKLI